MFSRSDVYYSRSIHASGRPPRGAGAFRDNAELAERVAADQKIGFAGRYGGPPESPCGSVTSMTSSAMRRRARSSLHVLPRTQVEPHIALAETQVQVGGV
jgi:hypothetical protein